MYSLVENDATDCRKLSICRPTMVLLFQWWLITTMHYGNRVFAKCNFLCRGLKVGHSAKSYFAECRTRQRAILLSAALGNDINSAKKALPTVRYLAKPDTRQRPFLPSVRHSANPGARQKAASGNGRRLSSRFAECQRVGTRQTTSLPSARPWHSAKNNGKLFFPTFKLQNFSHVLL